MVICPRTLPAQDPPQPLSLCVQPQASDPMDRGGTGVGLTQALRPLVALPQGGPHKWVSRGHTEQAGWGVTSTGQQAPDTPG